MPNGRRLGLPLWMLDEAQCAIVRDAPHPVIALSAFQSLRRLLDAQPLLAGDASGDDGGSSPLSEGVTDDKEDRPPTSVRVHEPAQDTRDTAAGTSAAFSASRADDQRADPANDNQHD